MPPLTHTQPASDATLGSSHDTVMLEVEDLVQEHLRQDGGQIADDVLPVSVALAPVAAVVGMAAPAPAAPSATVENGEPFKWEHDTAADGMTLMLESFSIVVMPQYGVPDCQPFRMACIVNTFRQQSVFSECKEESRQLSETLLRSQWSKGAAFKAMTGEEFDATISTSRPTEATILEWAAHGFCDLPGESYWMVCCMWPNRR